LIRAVAFLGGRFFGLGFRFFAWLEAAIFLLALVVGARLAADFALAGFLFDAFLTGAFLTGAF